MNNTQLAFAILSLLISIPLESAIITGGPSQTLFVGTGYTVTVQFRDSAFRQAFPVLPLPNQAYLSMILDAPIDQLTDYFVTSSQGVPSVVLATVSSSSQSSVVALLQIPSFMPTWAGDPGSGFNISTIAITNTGKSFSITPTPPIGSTTVSLIRVETGIRYGAGVGLGDIVIFVDDHGPPNPQPEPEPQPEPTPEPGHLATVGLVLIFTVTRLRQRRLSKRTICN